jgi:prepilin-type N-terminal cleavage/methylation domain-containing protein
MIAHRCHARRTGFALVEIMAVLVIIGLLATLTAALTRDKLDEGKVIAAVSQMNSIKKAVADGFYRDFGCIPEEVHRPSDYPNAGAGHTVDSREGNVPRNQNPEYATRFLCLERDCTNNEITELLSKCFLNNQIWSSQASSCKAAAQKWGGDNGCLGCAFMTKALWGMRDSNLFYFVDYGVDVLRYSLMPDPSVGSKGWTGPYLACNSWINASALHRADGDQYPAIYYSDPSFMYSSPYFEAVTKDVHFPVITTPWADDLEAAAREAEADQNPDLAKELRKGRYYQILVYSSLKLWNDLLDPPWDEGFPGAQVPETAVIISRGADGLPGAAEDASTIGAEDYWMQCAEMARIGPTEEQRKCFRRLAITDPNDPDYVNIGDDMVLFIFGDGPVRSPLEK